ncbi:MAG: hypothetical protein Q4D50_11305 [Eubacteriales bacterium]|nr:hypothetical protein [Eubacteriales bacterium]
MKRWIILAAAAAVVLMSPSRKETDVGELLPVELLYIYKEESGIWVQTDTGDLGIGADLQSALKDLKETAPGKIFLDTADYLIITKETVDLLPQLWGILRPSTEVCLGINADTQAAAFLSAHKPGVTLNDIRSGGRFLPTLIRTGERYYLVS